MFVEYGNGCLNDRLYSSYSFANLGYSKEKCVIKEIIHSVLPYLHYAWYLSQNERHNCEQNQIDVLLF